MGRAFIRSFGCSSAAALLLGTSLAAMAQDVRLPPPAPPPNSKARGPVPKDISRWAALIQQNYPRDPAGGVLEGSVRVRAVVNPEGRVIECIILKSSGYPTVDQTACYGMTRFAVFTPATDGEGSPTIGAYTTLITYRDPSPEADPEPSGETKD